MYGHSSRGGANTPFRKPTFVNRPRMSSAITETRRQWRCQYCLNINSGRVMVCEDCQQVRVEVGDVVIHKDDDKEEEEEEEEEEEDGGVLLPGEADDISLKSTLSCMMPIHMRTQREMFT